MRASEYLFPNELRVTSDSLANVLVVGSCLAETYVQKFQSFSPETCFDFILFNNASQLPATPPQPVQSYDLQYVQIPLRSILTDEVVRFSQLGTSDWKRIHEASHARLEVMYAAASRYAQEGVITTLVSNFVVPQGRAVVSLDAAFGDGDLGALVLDLNQHLAQLVSQTPHAFVADVEGIAATLGKRHFLDDVFGFYAHGGVYFPDWALHERTPAWSAPEPGRLEELPPLEDLYPCRTDEFFESVFAQVVHMNRVVRGTDQVKAVVFDLDNTLWRGLIGDHYGPGQTHPHTHGWPLGIWEAVHHLRARGIAVAVCSKNDEALVRARWDTVVNPPFLSLDDFTLVEIGWGPKVEGVTRIVDALGLTAKSVLFVDDNPVERASVEAALPGIRTTGSNPFTTRRTLLWSAETQRAVMTGESLDREASFRGKFQRDEQAAAMSRADFLTSLECKISFGVVTRADDARFARAMELLNKTNQFNTLGKRWSLGELSAFLEAKGAMVVFAVADKFSDYGQVGTVLLRDKTIEQFTMSCRVLGMGVETAALSWIVEWLRRDGSSRDIIGVLRHTESNAPCRELFAENGFQPSKVPGVWVLPPESQIELPGHVKILT